MLSGFGLTICQGRVVTLLWAIGGIFAPPATLNPFVNPYVIHRPYPPFVGSITMILDTLYIGMRELAMFNEEEKMKRIIELYDRQISFIGIARTLDISVKKVIEVLRANGRIWEPR